jgi:putative oxidoreductase
MFSESNYIAIVGRTLVALMFIANGIGVAKGFDVVSAQMSGKGVPMASLALSASIALLLGGGFALLVGWKVQWLAWIFFVWMIPATLVFHAPWAFPPEQFQEQLIHFLKNLAILGALLLLVAGSAEATQ